AARRRTAPRLPGASRPSQDRSAVFHRSQCRPTAGGLGPSSKRNSAVPAIVDCTADPAIPALAVVLDAVELDRILDALLPSHHGGSRDLQIGILRYHPGKRCVFEIVRDSTDGPRSWIGKVYAADRADVYQTMDAISRAGFGPAAECSIPAPIAYVRELRFLLQEKVACPFATEFFLSDHDDVRRRKSPRSSRRLGRFRDMSPHTRPTR